MRNRQILGVFVLVLMLCLIAGQADTLDYPHNPQANNYNCDSCHLISGSNPSLLVDVSSHSTGLDDSIYNNLCWGCHNDVDAVDVVTHSYLRTDDDYGEWSVECITCHHPHTQRQVKQYTTSTYLVTGTLTNVEIDTPSANQTRLTDSSKTWTDDEFIGLSVIPDTGKRRLGYKILDNTATTLIVDKNVDETYIASGDTYVVVYGKLIKETIETDEILVNAPTTKGVGDKTVRLFTDTGTNSFGDADATYDGICEICHTMTANFRYDGSQFDTLHAGMDGADCIGCHSHSSGFAHGIGSSGAVTNCVKCHGHDAGTNYDPDGTAPYSAGGTASQGKGTYVAHSIHTETDTGDYDNRGPEITGASATYCDTCHDTVNMPYFATGTDANADGKYDLAETDVCDDCHSPGGSYDGVDDVAVGAKNNWSIYASSASKIYNGTALRSGKEKWCVTCHDEAATASVISTITAPNIAGDEDDSDYTYGSLSGTGWGYYKTGHGLPSGSAYPESGGAASGAGKECLDCHLSTPDHIDGLARTFDDDNSGSDQSDEYRIGYRLQQVGGQEPMQIPKNNDGNSASDYRLCMQTGCHPDDGTGPFLDSTNLNTNFRIGDSPGDNYHNYHLDFNNAEYSPDWDGGGSISEPTCVVCHNVHGSKRLVMLRDGTLTGATDGFEIWYNNPSIVESGNPPNPDDLPLTASTGTIYQRDSATDFCAASCHSTNIATTTRDPFQTMSQDPTLVWTGETNYIADGVNPNNGESGGNFVFRVEYNDQNNDAPTSIQVWVDTNDDGDYLDTNEKLDMTGANVGDTNYHDGKVYTKTLTLSSAGDNTFNYRFYASDGADATGSPTSDNTFSIVNSAPALTWTGETFYVSDGVNPDTGGDGASYVFRVKYTDADNTTPSAIQIWIDKNDDGDYLDTNEKQNMALVGGDSDYTNGELYSRALALFDVGDGSHNYRFYASDGTDDATGSPISNSTVMIQSTANNPPTLEWAVATCLTDGVKPASGLATGNFEFKIKYSDRDSGDGCPVSDTSAIQVWLDEDDDATYQADEKFNLVEDDSGDTDCTDGKIYKVTRQPGYAGDGIYNYRFYSTDGTDTAIGDPVTTGSTVTVLSTTGRKGVRVGSGDTDPWYNSIQSAIDAVTDDNTVLVYEGTYNESLYIWSNDDNTTLQSVCGADSTIITYSSGNTVLFLSNSGSTLDGFTITGGSDYGIFLNSSSPSITNSKIHSISGPGIYVCNVCTLTLSNSEVYLNTARGIFINGSSGHTVTNSIIRDNTGAGGAGVYSNSGDITFTDTTIKNNTATGAGGAVNANSADVEFYRCIITGNVASGRSGAIELANIGATASLENSIIADNQGTYGGVSYVNGGSFTAINSTFANNQATSTNGGVFSNNSGTITVRNSILWNNQANTDGHIAYFNGTPGMVISDSIISNDGDDIFTDGPYFHDATPPFDTPTISGYTSESDPLFINETGGDYHIQSSSDAIDNANATYAPANDIDSESRPQGSADDIGSDEYVSDSYGPVLTWTGETNYASDGVNPNSGAGESSFEFRVTYADADNDAPTSIQLWIDEDDSSTYELDEKYDMSAANYDTVYTDGKIYTKTLTLSFAGDTNLNYRFSASDGTVDATGDPTSDNTVTVTNNVPDLDWTGETNYTTDGVDPNTNTSGSNYVFRVKYTDVDNTAPSYIEVWVDEDDSGTYTTGEKYAMTIDGGDSDYTNGENYTKTLAISYDGDGTLNYTFRASDGTDTATGNAIADSNLIVE